MGTMIQRYKLDEADYRGERFKDHGETSRATTSCCRSRSRESIARSTSSICAPARTSSRPTRSARPRWRRPTTAWKHSPREMNLAGARLAREACDKFTHADKPRFVAGAIGPTPKTASICPDVNDPAARNVTFDELRARVLRAGRGPARRRLRPVPRRNDLRHAQRQGGAVRARRTDRRHRRAAAGDDLGHGHRRLGADSVGPDGRARSGIRCATRGRSRSASTARWARR